MVKLTKFEKGIVDLIKHEENEHVLIICSKDDHVFYQNTDSDNESVRLPVNDRVLKESTIIHNHPVWKWIDEDKNFESGFSSEDVLAGLENKADKLILIETYPKYYLLYVLKFNGFFTCKEEYVKQMVESKNYTVLWSYDVERYT